MRDLCFPFFPTYPLPLPLHLIFPSFLLFFPRNDPRLLGCFSPRTGGKEWGKFKLLINKIYFWPEKQRARRGAAKGWTKNKIKNLRGHHYGPEASIWIDANLLSAQERVELSVFWFTYAADFSLLYIRIPRKSDGSRDEGGEGRDIGKRIFRK